MSTMTLAERIAAHHAQVLDLTDQALRTTRRGRSGCDCDAEGPEGGEDAERLARWQSQVEAEQQIAQERERR